jgi:hypothetical protein
MRQRAGMFAFVAGLLGIIRLRPLEENVAVTRV